MTPEEQARLAELRSEDSAPIQTPKSSMNSRIRELVLRGKALTPGDISSLLSKLDGFKTPTPTRLPETFAAPPKESKAPIPELPEMTAAEAKKLEMMRNEGEVGTSFGNIVKNAKDFLYTKPAEGAEQIRRVLMEGGDMPSASDIVEHPFTAPQVAAMTAIGNLAKNVVPTEQSMVEAEMKTGRKQVGRALVRGAAEAITSAIPLTPGEIAMEAFGGKLMTSGMGAAAKGAEKIGMPTIASAMEAATPAAEQALFRASQIAEGGGSRALTARAMKYELPKVKSQISALAKEVKLAKPVTDMLAPVGELVAPPKASSIQEVQQQHSIPIPGPAPKKGFKIQSPADASPKLMRESVQEAKRIAKSEIAVPKEYQPKKVNIVELKAQQDVANELRQQAIKEEDSGLMGRLGLKRSFNRLDEFMATSGWRNLERIGPVGQTLKKWGESALANSEIRAGGAKVVMRNAIKDLSAYEKNNLIDVLDEGIQPVSNNVRIAAEAIKSINQQIEREATNLLKLKRGDSVIPWMGRKNYFPHIMDHEKVDAVLAARGTTAYDELIDNVIRRHPGETKASAARLLEDMSIRHKASNFGPLEKSRQFDSPLWVRDIDSALSIYYDGAFKRLEIAKTFGPQNQKADALINLIKDKRQFDIAQDVVKGLTGINPITGTDALARATFSEPVRIAGNTLMALSQTSNAMQGLYGSAIRVGLPNALRGMAKAWSPYAATRAEARQFAVKAGGLIEDIALESNARMVSRDFLKKSGFEFLEEQNRIVSSNAARYHAADLLELMKSGKDAALVDREFLKLGLNKTAVMKRGAFNDFEIRKIAHAITDISQGRSREVDLPIFANSGIGRVVFHLRNFSFNWARMVKEEVINEARKGNWGPARNFLATGAILGEPVAMFREATTGQKRSDKIPWTGGMVGKLTDPEIEKQLARRIDAIAWLGGIGMGRDVLRAMETGTPADLLIPAMAKSGAEVFKTGIDIAKGMRQQEGAKPPVATAMKFAGRRVAPLFTPSHPALAVPWLIGTRAIGERADALSPLMFEGGVKAMDKGSEISSAIKRRLFENNRTTK